MSRFAIKTPYLIVVLCLVTILVGIVSIARMPVDLFPAMNIPVVAVATFYPGMPPEQIEGNITYHLERFFTLASGIDHMESRSLSGVSMIKVYFQPGTNRGFRGHHHREPGDGGDQPSSSRHAAAVRPQDGFVQPAGVPGDIEGRRAVRNAVEGHRAERDPQPDGRRARRRHHRSRSADDGGRSCCTSIRTSSNRAS